MDDNEDASSENSAAAAQAAREAAAAVLKLAEERERLEHNHQHSITSSPSHLVSPFKSMKEKVQRLDTSMKEKVQHLDEKLYQYELQQEKWIEEKVNQATEELYQQKEQIRVKVNKTTAELVELLSPKSKSKENQFNQDQATTAAANEKILEDLELVHEQMTLCNSLLLKRESEDRALLAVIGFLEACLDRLEELVVCNHSELSEETTQICLTTYDRLIMTLEKCDSPLVA